ncbi:hydrolase [Oceanicola sp. 22II-s10i]|nr:hydrolase [Oceanicola sp. 22II-s10i]
MIPGAVDCDVHPASPAMKELMPYLDDYLSQSVVDRGIEQLTSVHYPPNAPITCREDWRGPGDAASALKRMQTHLLDGMGVGTAILNQMLGIQILFNADMGAAFARGLNDFMAREWLDKDDRLRASMVLPQQSPELCVDEIERLAGDKRFVQVMMLVMGDRPLGHQMYWPIYRAAEKHGLPIAIHAGSMYRHPLTGVGWSSYHSQDYAANAVNFQTTVTSLIAEGVFTKFPNLKVVMSESGWTWLPAYLWRMDKYWHGLRMLTPWVDRLPREIIADNFRFTLQPVDAPPDRAVLEKLMEHVGTEDLLLFSTDYPHWQFDGTECVPDGFSDSQLRKMMIDTPKATYSRL